MERSAFAGQLCCTVRLLAELGLKPSAVPRPEPVDDPLATWYGDLFYERRRKCVIFMNAASGYVAFALYVKRADIRLLPERLPNFLRHSLPEDGFSEPGVERVVGSVRSLTICRTADRSTLAHINRVRLDIVHFFDSAYEEGRIPNDLESARHINHALYGPKWDPVGALAELVGEKLPPQSDRLFLPDLLLRVEELGSNDSNLS